MDSNDQERERGITILAKAASIEWRGVRINLVDTPGHADFGGEVERALAMVDGVLLLVDAAEGPLPQTRYVLSKALARKLPAVVVINKVDRGDARADEVLDEVEQLFMDLATDAEQLGFPVVSAIAREGRTVAGVGMPATDDDVAALLDTVLATVPPPAGDAGAAAAGAGHQPRRQRLPRPARHRAGRERRAAPGRHRRPARGGVRRGPGAAAAASLTQLLAFRGIGREEVEELAAGDLFVVAGFPEVEIGDTIASADEPVALPRLDGRRARAAHDVRREHVAAGRARRAGTSRRATCASASTREMLGNVSIRFEETDSPDVIEVAGRGELQLAVLIESMRREGYELQVSRPEVITKEIDGHRHEPLERGVCDVPDEHVGTVTQALAPRKGRVHRPAPGRRGPHDRHVRGAGARADRVPLAAARPPRGARRCSTSTTPAGRRGPASCPTARGGAMVADRLGDATAFALDNLQLRGELFVGPGDVVYEGMVIGESSRSDDMVVNAVRAKEKTNIRTHSHDEGVKLAPPTVHTLETAIEFIADDELVEVTPSAVRIRKRLLTEHRAPRASDQALTVLRQPLSRRTAGWGSTARFERGAVELSSGQRAGRRARRPAPRSRRASCRNTASRPTKASGASVHHQWNSWPPSPQSRRFHSRSVEVTWPCSSVCSCEAQRQLPAHVGLPVHRPLAGLQRRLVQRAAGAPWGSRGG